MKFFHYKGEKSKFDLNYFTYFFPQNIIKGKKTLIFIPEILEKKKKIAVLADKFLMKNFYSFLNLDGDVFLKIIFNGECSPKEFFRLKQIVLSNKIDCLICLGGGKAMDIAKLVKRDVSGLLLILVPTSAATCAAITSVSVMYDEKGKYIKTTESVCADFVVIDYEIFYKLPLVFFSAGIADTISKYFEIKAARKFIREKDLYGDIIFKMAEKLYLRLKEITYSNWNNMNNEIKEELTDINIIFSGIISLIGKFNITVSAAHTIAHSLTIKNPSQKFLHGEYVSFGLFIQENLLNNKKNIKELESFYIIHDLPFKLSQLNIYKQDLDSIFEFYLKLKKEEKIIFPVKDKMVYNQFIKNL